MHGSFARAQAQYDAMLPDSCFDAAENTNADALRYILTKACRAAEQHVDSAECGVTESSDGDCMVTLSLWPVRVDTKRQYADALMAVVAELLK